jgi:N-dimethylarginine dimethylaminohydrolase
MLETSQTSALLQDDALNEKDRLRLSKELEITLIDTEDPFCLNSIIDGDHLLTHVLNNNELKEFLEHKTGKKVIELDTSEFEKSGGSVRCLVFDVHDPRLIKKKKHSHSNPSSPK